MFLHRGPAEVIAVGRRDGLHPPLTQDVLLPVVTGLGHLDGVEITELRDGWFSAAMVFDGGTRVPGRPSDALAVAVREDLSIGMVDAILDAGGQPIADLFPGGTDAPPDQQLRDFREFLDEVSRDDFGTPGG